MFHQYNWWKTIYEVFESIYVCIDTIILHIICLKNTMLTQKQALFIK